MRRFKLRRLMTNKWHQRFLTLILFAMLWIFLYIFYVAMTYDMNVQGVEQASLPAIGISRIIFEHTGTVPMEEKNSGFHTSSTRKFSTNVEGTISNQSASSLCKSCIPATEMGETAGICKTSLELLDQLIDGYEYDTRGSGEMGRPCRITGCNGMEERFKENQFNVVVSEHISVNRSLPYVAPLACQAVIYPEQLPACSIVIVFYNEAWSTLFRSVHSVLNRSPVHLLKEVILIDDGSDRGEQIFASVCKIVWHCTLTEHLKERLEKYLRNFAPKVRLHRLLEHSGLINARLQGARRADGDVLIFLDSHIEVTAGWLEPLLSRVKNDRTIVVSPVIDNIHHETFEYIPLTDLNWGTFNWGLDFRWSSGELKLLRNRSSLDTISPYQTPIIAGGLFAVDKQYFWNIGSYDEAMKIWGGENVEMSLRVWMCGGSMEIHPCSHVGHVYRSKSPYQHGNGTFNAPWYNAARTVEVWLDEYKNFFYSTNFEMNSSSAGDVSRRLALRYKLGCKSFKWYLENIHPESSIPATYYSLGTIMNDETQTCIEKVHIEGGFVILNLCSNESYYQTWSYTSGYQIQNDERCLVWTENIGVFATDCLFADNRGEWDYDNQNKWLRHRRSGLCLTATSWIMTMQRCQVGLMIQSWTIHGYDGKLKPNP